MNNLELLIVGFVFGLIISLVVTNLMLFGVAGVLADGRCLFRAIAHGACLRSGVAAPDDNRQRELADELRAQVLLLFIIKALSFLWNLEVGKFMTLIVYNL